MKLITNIIKLVYYKIIKLYYKVSIVFVMQLSFKAFFKFSLCTGKVCTHLDNSTDQCPKLSEQ
jgi:hypothetical protein